MTLSNLMIEDKKKITQFSHTRTIEIQHNKTDLKDQSRGAESLVDWHGEKCLWFEQPG